MASHIVSGGLPIPYRHPLASYSTQLTFMAGDSLVASEFTVANEVVPRLVAATVMLTHVRAASGEGVNSHGRRLERQPSPFSQSAGAP